MTFVVVMCLLSWDAYEIQVEEQRHTVQTEEYRHITKEVRSFYSRWESITGESPTSFPEENTTMLYWGFEAEPTRLQAEGYIYHTGWAGCKICKQHRPLHYNGNSMETKRNVGDRAKLVSYLVTMLPTWRLIERCRSSYDTAPPGEEFQQSE
ncbi:hypothetical protein TNCV_4925491 [Trichonephila clavipes]|nr:hypothetical protein TNCV_4925491 [Trichonephila clavipes]